jgi:hypothetical protein
MFDIFEKIFGYRSAELIKSWLPDPFVINSFDCARRSMGVAIVDIDPYIFVPKLFICGNVLERIMLLEAHVNLLSEQIDRVIRLSMVDVWDLGDVKRPCEAAPALKCRLTNLDAKNGTPSCLAYEFQMDLNDKSRMISTMIAYHYSGTHTVCMPPAEKNKIVIAHKISEQDFCNRCTRTSNRKIQTAGRRITMAKALFQKHNAVDLSIAQFLRHFTKTYTANKTHTASMLEWWSSIFNISLDTIPVDCTDDAADAFIQVLAGLRTRKF